MDSSFPSAPFPGFTTDELRLYVASGHEQSLAMLEEITRRGRVQAGDTSAMTPGERLRYAPTGRAR